MTSIDDRELKALSVELGAVAGKTAKATFAALTESGADLLATWRANATETAGEHGRLYPRAITSTTRLAGGGLEVEVGPDKNLPQGGMSFEFGSVNQPAHLDGQRAADEMLPRFERRIGVAMDGLFQ